MRRIFNVCLAFFSVVLIAVAIVGCGPRDKEPVPETPTAQPETPPETPPTAPENPGGEQRGSTVEINPDDIPEDDFFPAGSASGRR